MHTRSGSPSPPPPMINHLISIMMTHYSLAYNIGESFLYSPCIHENKTRLIPLLL